jgi:hypothetical protein
MVYFQLLIYIAILEQNEKYMEINMGMLKKCLHQIIRPSRKNPSRQKEVGECYNCQTHEDNKFCKCYTPVSDFVNFKVEKNNKE